MGILMMRFFLSDLSEEVPRYTLSESMFKAPGLCFRPRPEQTINEANAIVYNMSDRKSYETYLDNITEFLKPYKDETYQTICNWNCYPPLGYICAFDIQKFKHCNEETDFGFAEGRPCIFVKLNRIFDWVPVVYKSVDEFPNSMPKELIERILIEIEEDPKAINQVWVSCEILLGPGIIKYDSDISGFPSYYYPFTNQKGYLSPLIAFYIENENEHAEQMIECRLWAKNIPYQYGTFFREGSFLFYMHINGN